MGKWRQILEIMLLVIWKLFSCLLTKMLTAGKESEGVSEECYDLVNAKNRGGLWYANKNVIGIFTVTENILKLVEMELHLLKVTKLLKR